MGEKKTKSSIFRTRTRVGPVGNKQNFLLGTFALDGRKKEIDIRRNTKITSGQTNMADHSSCVFTGALALALSLNAAPAAAFHPGSLSQTAAMRRAPPAAPRQQPTEGLRASRMTLINSEVRLRPRVLAQDRSERSWDAGQSLR